MFVIFFYFIIEEDLASERFCVFSQKRDDQKNLKYIPPKHEIMYLSARNTSYVFSVAGAYYTGEQRRYSVLQKRSTNWSASLCPRNTAILLLVTASTFIIQSAGNASVTQHRYTT